MRLPEYILTCYGPLAIRETCAKDVWHVLELLPSTEWAEVSEHATEDAAVAAVEDLLAHHCFGW